MVQRNDAVFLGTYDLAWRRKSGLFAGKLNVKVIVLVRGFHFFVSKNVCELIEIIK